MKNQSLVLLALVAALVVALGAYNESDAVIPRTDMKELVVDSEGRYAVIDLQTAKAVHVTFSGKTQDSWTLKASDGN